MFWPEGSGTQAICRKYPRPGKTYSHAKAAGQERVDLTVALGGEEHLGDVRGQCKSPRAMGVNCATYDKLR